jgi:hypothetical protein
LIRVILFADIHDQLTQQVQEQITKKIGLEIANFILYFEVSLLYLCCAGSLIDLLQLYPFKVIKFRQNFPAALLTSPTNQRTDIVLA